MPARWQRLQRRAGKATGGKTKGKQREASAAKSTKKGCIFSPFPWTCSLVPTSAIYHRFPHQSFPSTASHATAQWKFLTAT
uniref:Uncharacterized protein n=1 Tax=Setaria italica TaxID=4555 RepID=K4AP93_SETIT